MRIAIVMCMALLLCGSFRGQAGNDVEHVIRRIVDSGISDGHDQKVIGTMGDAAAVVVTKILAGRNLTALNIDGALVVFESSFAYPHFVSIVADREPRTTLFVLRCLDSSTSDPALKKRIEEAKVYVQQHYTRSMQGPT